VVVFRRRWRRWCSALQPQPPSVLRPPSMHWLGALHRLGFIVVIICWVDCVRTVVGYSIVNTVKMSLAKQIMRSSFTQRMLASRFSRCGLARPVSTMHENKVTPTSSQCLANIGSARMFGSLNSFSDSTFPEAGDAVVLPTLTSNPKLKSTRITAGVVLALAVQRLFKDSLCAGIVCSENGYVNLGLLHPVR
jgi:hypothetical protein